MIEPITRIYRPMRIVAIATMVDFAAMFLTPAIADPIQTMDLRSYLEASLRNHLTQNQHEALTRVQAISLRNGKRYYWPEITARTDYTESTEETDATTAVASSRTIQSGVTSGLDTNWTSPLGTDLTLGLEYQYGRQLGKKDQGIPENDLQTQMLSIEISQPLLKHNGLFYNRLPLLRAQTEWVQFQSEGDLNSLTVLKEAMLSYLSAQEAYDRLKFQSEKLEHVQYLSDVTETLQREGRSLSLDRDIAHLDIQKQEQAIAIARLDYRRRQQELTLSWINPTSVMVQPQPSMKSLIDRLLPVYSANKDVTQHPEYRQKRLDLRAAELEEKASRRDRWPDVDAFFRYEKSYREALPDTENQAWGLRFSYALFDLPTRKQQARNQADAIGARWEAQDRLSHLEWESLRLQEGSETLLDNLDLQDRSIQLSQKALEYELARFREGLASYSEVRQRQQDRLEQQLEELSTRVELAQNLIELAYYRQWNWLDDAL